jgi:hypothetical protein
MNHQGCADRIDRAGKKGGSVHEQNLIAVGHAGESRSSFSAVRSDRHVSLLGG